MREWHNTQAQWTTLLIISAVKRNFTAAKKGIDKKAEW